MHGDTFCLLMTFWCRRCEFSDSGAFTVLWELSGTVLMHRAHKSDALTMLVFSEDGSAQKSFHITMNDCLICYFELFNSPLYTYLLGKNNTFNLVLFIEISIAAFTATFVSKMHHSGSSKDQRTKICSSET